MDPRGDGEDFRRHVKNFGVRRIGSKDNSSAELKKIGVGKDRGKMPANRVALYNGILRDRRVVQRLAYSCS